MTHEFKKIVHTYLQAQKEGLKTVLATVVAVDGSSYRGAGVRMLVVENNKTVGAISGGCVEKEVVHQAQSVFATGIAKMMTYDGRFRLGCEGTLYVLLENFDLADLFYDIHVIGNYTLIVLVIMHIFAVIAHKILFKDNLLKKIL